MSVWRYSIHEADPRRLADDHKYFIGVIQIRDNNMCIRGIFFLAQ